MCSLDQVYNSNIRPRNFRKSGSDRQRPLNPPCNNNNNSSTRTSFGTRLKTFPEDHLCSWTRFLKESCFRFSVYLKSKWKAMVNAFIFSTCCRVRTLCDRVLSWPRFSVYQADSPHEGNLTDCVMTQRAERKKDSPCFWLKEETFSAPPPPPLPLAHYTQVMPFQLRWTHPRAEHFQFPWVMFPGFLVQGGVWNPLDWTSLGLLFFPHCCAMFPFLFLIHGGNKVWYFITLSGPQTNVCSSPPRKKKENGSVCRTGAHTLKGTVCARLILHSLWEF